jgi:hypothetical protein
MNRRSLLLAVLSGAVTLSFLGACVGNDPIGTEPSPIPADFTLTTGVMPAFSNSGCVAGGCHLGPTGQGGVALGGGGMTSTDVYNSLHAVDLQGNVPVDTANAMASVILTAPLQGASGTTHTGTKPWTTGNSDYKTVLGWIQAGALNN